MCLQAPTNIKKELMFFDIYKKNLKENYDELLDFDDFNNVMQMDNEDNKENSDGTNQLNKRSAGWVYSANKSRQKGLMDS